MAARPGFPAVLAAAAILAACAQPRTTCGDPSPAGGPPVVATRDGELCEAVRLRVAEHLGRLARLGPEEAQFLRDRTWSWEDARSVEGFLRRAREDAGEEFAAAVARAVEEVAAHGTKPPRPGCADAERCLVRGAALGARIALDDAAGVLLVLRRNARRAEQAQ